MSDKTKIILSREDAQDAIDGDHEGFDVILDNISETTRWSEIHKCVLQRKSDGAFFKTSYSRGLTEMQDESPYEHETEVEMEEVFRETYQEVRYV